VGRRRIVPTSGEIDQNEVPTAQTSTSDAVLPWTDETPPDRLARLGPGALSASELLTLLLPPVGVREGASEQMVQLLSQRPWPASLAQATLPELVRNAGLSSSEAAVLLAARELGRQLYASPSARRPAIRTPADVVALIGPDMRYLDREHFRAVLLSTRHDVLAVEEVAVGGLNSAVIHPREVFKAAIRQSAAALILVHNHPLGTPSRARMISVSRHDWLRPGASWGSRCWTTWWSGMGGT